MARVLSPDVVPSTHFPKELKFLVKQGTEPPQLSKAQERAAKTIGRFAWLVYRARKRRAVATKLADRWRDEVLKRWPENLYGLHIYNRRSIQARRAVPEEVQPTDILAFIQWLGAEAPEIINSFSLPWEKLLIDPDFYVRLISFIEREHSATLADKIRVDYSRTKLQERIDDGRMPEPPADMFRSVPGRSVTLLVDRIDNRGNVIKEPRSDSAA